METDAAVVRRVRARYDQIAQSPEAFSKVFFERLFEVLPGVRDLLPADLMRHGEYVEAAFSAVIRNLGDIDVLAPALEELGRLHARRGIGPEQLAEARHVLMATVRVLSGDRWSEQDEHDWALACALVLAPMSRGASREPSAPLRTKGALSR